MSNPIFVRLTVQACSECGAIYVTSDEHEGQVCRRYLADSPSLCAGTLRRLRVPPVDGDRELREAAEAIWLEAEG